MVERDPSARRRALVLRATALGGLFLVIVGLGASQSVWVMVGLVLGIAVLLRPWLPMDVAVPAAAALLYLGAVCLGVVVGWVNGSISHVPVLLGVLFSGAALAVVVYTWIRPVRARELDFPLKQSWWAFAPAVIPALLAFGEAVRFREAASWMFLATDPAAHLVLLADLQRSGGLDYVASGYPRGLHALAAWASVPSIPASDPFRLLDFDTVLFGGLTWLVLALVLWTSAAVAIRLAVATALRVSVAATGVSILGFVLLSWGDATAVFVVGGAIASAFAVVVVWLLALLLLVEPQRLAAIGPLLLTGIGAAVCLAHLWQPLVAAAALAVALAMLPPKRTGPEPRDAPSRARWLIGLPIAGFLLAIALTPLLSVLRSGGVGAAATPGLMPAVPWYDVVTALACSAVLMLLSRSAGVRAFVGGILGLTVAVAVLLLGAQRGLDFEQWYPAKATWTLILAAIPAVAVVGSEALARLGRWCWTNLGRWRPGSFVLRSSAIAAVVIIGGAVVAAWLAVFTPLPVVLALGGGSQVRMEQARKYVAAAAPAVPLAVEVGMSEADGSANVTLAHLFTFLTGQPDVAPRLDGACRAVEETRVYRDVVVVTALRVPDVAAALKEQGCGGVPILQIPGRRSLFEDRR